MPGSASSQDVLQQTVDGFAKRVTEYADGIAGRLGQPLSGTQLSKEDVVARWNFSPLGSPGLADQAYHQMVASGTPPGKALDQVYPMRSMLFRGPDLHSAIDTAKQIQGWAADASGQDVPEAPQGSTLVQHLLNQSGAQAPPMPVPMPGAGAPPMPPQGPAVAMPGIPAMQGGGVVTQPTLALIGEAGPEAVVPLSQQPRDDWARSAPGQSQVGYGPSNFVASLRPLAQQAETTTGIPANVYLAMAANETGWGRSQTAQQNNLFSIQGSGANGQRWATYDSPLESFQDFAQLISTNPRYAQAWDARENPQQFLNELRKAGYVADEPGYPAAAWVNQVSSIYRELAQQQPARRA